MIERIRVKNFRTHVDSTIELGGITLLIGNNNSGKSNLLAAIQHLSKLVGRSRPSSDPALAQEDGVSSRALLRMADLFPHRHRLHADKPMEFEVVWKHRDVSVHYSLELYEDNAARNRVACRERIIVVDGNGDAKEAISGFDSTVDQMLLNAKVESRKEWPATIKEMSRSFFRDLAQAFGYHFQPNFLRGSVARHSESSEADRVREGPLRIAPQLGYEGGNLQELVVEAREKDERTFEKFIAELRRFNPSFHGVRRPKGSDKVVWEFDLGGGPPSRLDEFSPEVVSDGVLKAAAVALLTSTRYPPALILLEEIENGINPANIKGFMAWLFQSSSPIHDLGRDFATQFIITSHSPTVLREFAGKLDNVYVVRLRQRGFVSDVRNLAAALDVLVGVGTVDGEIVEENGKRRVHIAPYQLAELWNNGVIG